MASFRALKASFKQARLWNHVWNADWIPIRSVATSCFRTQKQPTPNVQRMGKGLPKKIPIAGVSNVILVGSGKGGVGKSTIAVNLAAAIQKVTKDKSVGILDADVFGPSIPTLMNLEGKQPTINKQNLLVPLLNYGLKCMSMGFLVEQESAFIWRGLMVMQAIERLLRGVAWGPLDYLVVDLPPGTGDVQLSIAQNIPVSGAVVVSTPQKLAIADARRSCTMFSKVNIPVLGIIQNMNTFVCENCSHITDIFGSHGAEELSKEIGATVIGDVPLDVHIRESSDIGQPIVISDPQSPSSQAFITFAEQVIKLLPPPLFEI